MSSGFHLMFYRVRKVFLLIAGLFLLFVVGSIVVKSNARKSLLEGAVLSSTEGELQEALSSPINNSSELHLQDFHRVEVRKGSRIWEVRAKDAKYFAKDNLAHVSDADVTIYRKKKDNIKFHAKAGKLLLEGDALVGAEMEGSIKVNLNGSMILLTENATYDASEQKITAPGNVKIKGPGFEIAGAGLTFLMEQEIVSLESRVESSFQEDKSAAKEL